MQIISEKYLKQQNQLHRDPNYGVASLAFSPLVAKIIKEQKLGSVSDYGAGKKRLLEGLKKEGIKKIDYLPFDPVFPEYGAPKPADLVCCVDVLEHIEPDFVESTLLNLHSITKKIGFFTIHTGPAGKILPDGRNAHLIQQTTSWWPPKLCQYFDIQHLQHHNLYGRGFWTVVTPKKKS